MHSIFNVKRKICMVKSKFQYTKNKNTKSLKSAPCRKIKKKVKKKKSRDDEDSIHTIAIATLQICVCVCIVQYPILYSSLCSFSLKRYSFFFFSAVYGVLNSI